LIMFEVANSIALYAIFCNNHKSI